MDADRIAEWALRSGFNRSGPNSLQKTIPKGTLSLEFKAKSLVMILIGSDHGMPRIRTSLFKDIPVHSESGEIVLAYF